MCHVSKEKCIVVLQNRTHKTPDEHSYSSMSAVPAWLSNWAQSVLNCVACTAHLGNAEDGLSLEGGDALVVLLGQLVRV